MLSRRFGQNIFIILMISLAASFHAVHGQVRVMPVGNSITAGKDPYTGAEGEGFRGYLKDMLGSGYVFVGDDEVVGTSPGLNGHFKSGAKIEAFLPGGEKDITAALTAHNPEVVLLHLGTNNVDVNRVVGPYTQIGTPSYNLKELINIIGKHQSVQAILVCKIIPKLDANFMSISKIYDYNKEIERMFFDAALSTKAVVVDMNSFVGTNELADGIHPVASGYQRMAEEYSNVTKAIINNPNDTSKPNTIAITDAKPSNEPSVYLEWYTPNDNGGGIANMYELRYTVDREINTSNFNSGTLVSLRRPGKNSPSSGREDTKVTDGILGGRTYYFAIRAYDQNNNVSSISYFPPQTTPDALPEPGITFVDNFDASPLPGWNADPVYSVSNGILSNTDGGSGWSKLAVFDSIKYTPQAEFVEASARYAPNSVVGGIGIAMLLDADDYRIASGYMIREYDGDLGLYSYSNGTLTEIAHESHTASVSAGDTLSVVYRNNPTANSFEVKLNGNSLGIVQDPNKLYGTSAVLYSGLILHGGVGSKVDNFGIKIPQLDPERMIVFGDQPLYGEVEKTLGPLSVQVLDLNGVGVANVAVDFNIISGVPGTLSADDVCGDFSGHYYIEAESGIIESPMASTSDPNASNGRFIYTRTYGKGLAVYKFWICEGRYDFIMRTYGPDGNSNSISFAIDDSSTFKDVSFSDKAEWEWNENTRQNGIYLSEGFHTLYIKGREPNARIDKMLFTQQSGFTPTGEGGTTPRFGNVTDTKGIVSTDMTFGTQAGEILIEARSDEVPPPENRVEFAPILVNGGTPETFAAVSDNIIQGEAGRDLAQPFEVEVLDAYGNPRRGEQVMFEVISGDGRFSGSEVAKANTNDDGLASAYMKLGYENETVIDVYLNNFPEVEHLTFKGVAEEGTVPFTLEQVNMENHFVTSVNSTIAESLQVRVLNQKGNPYEGYPVKFEIIAGSGSGSKLNGGYTSVVDSTDANGLSMVQWKIGTQAGEDAHIVRVNATLNGAPIEFTATATPDAPYQIAITGGDQQRQGVGKTFYDSLKVAIKDQYGNGIKNYGVRFSVVPGSGDGNFEGITGKVTANATIDVLTNNAGIAAVSYTAGAQNGQTQIKAEGLEVPALPTQNYRIFNLTVDPPEPQFIEIVSGNNQTKQISSTLSPFKVRVLDPFRNAVGANVQVKFQVTYGFSQFENSPEKVALTDADGIAQATLTLGQGAGEQKVLVTLSNYPEVAGVEFVATATPGAAVYLKPVSRTAFSDEAGSLVPITVRVEDTYQNKKPGHNVTFVAESGGVIKLPSGNTGTQLTLATNENGEATVNFLLGSKTSVTGRLLVTGYKADNSQLVGSPIEFVGTVLPGAPTQIKKESADGQSGTVLTLMQNPYRIQLLDANNNPVPNKKIIFEAHGKNAKVDDLPSVEKTTEADGRASVKYTLGQVAKSFSDTLTISIPGFDLETRYFMTALPGDPAIMSFNSDSVWNETLGSTQIRLTPIVTVTDLYGNLVNEQHPVTFKVKQGTSLLLPDNATTVTRNTVNGEAQVVWQLGTEPSEHKLEATSELNGKALTNSPLYFNARTVAGAPELIHLISPDQNPVRATANQPLLVRVQITDKWNNTVSRIPVTFTVLKPENDKGVLIDSLNNQSTKITLNCDTKGYAQVLFKPVVTTDTVNQISISVDRPGQQPAIFYLQVIGEAPAAKRIKILSDKNITVKANAKVDIQVAAYDATSGGNIVKNHTIAFTVKSGKGSLASTGNIFSTRQTGDNGIAQETWNVGSKIGRAVLVVDSGESLVGSPDSVIATIQPAEPFADSSGLKMMGALTAGIKGNVQISLRDQFGNPVSGYELTLTSPDAQVTLTQPSSPTDSDGFAYGQVMSTKSGIIRIGAQLKENSELKIAPIEVYVTHNQAAKLSLLSGQTNQFVGNVGAILKQPLTVRVTDAYDNPVSAGSAEVKFSLIAGSGSLEGENANRTSAFIHSDSLGRAAIQLIMGTADGEAHVVEASLSTPNEPSVKLTFTGQTRQPISPYALVKVSGDSLEGKVGQNLTEPFVVRVVDQSGIPVWSGGTKLVRFTSQVGDGEFVDGDYLSTDHYGHAETHYKFITGGTHTIKASVGSSFSVFFTAWAQAGAAAKMLPVESTEQEFVVNSEIKTVKVQVTDKDGNPVNDVPVIFSLIQEPQQGSGVIVDATAVNSGANGQPGVAIAKVTLGQYIGEYQIEAYSPQLAQTEKVIFTINATPGPAYYLSKYSGDQQFGTKNRTLVYPIVVKVMDEFLNPVPDVTVEFWANTAQGHGQPTKSTNPTDANGLAKTWWTIGNRDQCELLVQKIGLRPYPEDAPNTFVAFGVDNNFPEFKNMRSDTAIFTKLDFVLPLYAEDRDGDPLAYQIISGLPNGATFNPGNAAIYWTPTQTGQWTVHYRVDDNKSAPEHGFDVDSIKINVATKVEIFSSYPQDSFISIPYDGQQEFGISATGTNVAYEWILNGEKVPGATSSRFVVVANQYPNGAVHSLKGIAYDATNRRNQAGRLWGVRTKVELTSFEGASVPFEGVALNWKTSYEDGNIGFDVLRSSSKNGEFEKITAALIQSDDGSYAFTDTTAAAGYTYFYKLEDLDIGGQRSQSEAIMVTVDIPKEFMLLQNYPNPFNPMTTIRFQLPKAVPVKVAIFNINGQEVKRLIDDRKDAGYYEIRWTGQNNAGLQVSSGVYYYRIQTDNFTATKKMLLIR